MMSRNSVVPGAPAQMPSLSGKGPDMIEVQNQIKRNHADMQEMLHDLVDWSAKTNKREKGGEQAAAAAVKQSTAKLPPIRNKIDIADSIRTSQKTKKSTSDTAAKTAASKSKGNGPVVEELEKFKRDNSAMPDYYKAWDKFAKLAEEEDDEVQEAGQVKAVRQPEPQTQAEMMARTSGAAPNTSIVVKGGLRKQMSIAENFKQQGNSYFVSLEYSNAIDCYNKCLRAIDDRQASGDIKSDLEMQMIVLSNRSQAYLKLKSYPKAFEDASAALEFDPKHIKSLGRRGTAAYYLRKFKIALQDFQTIFVLEPQNKQFAEYLKKTLDKLQQVKTEAYEKLQRRVVFTDLTSMGFEEYSTPVPLTEIHLDKSQLQQQAKEKEEALERQEGGKKKDKKKKSRKKKGLSDFLDEGEDYEKAVGNENTDQNDKEEVQKTTPKVKETVEYSGLEELD